MTPRRAGRAALAIALAAPLLRLLPVAYGWTLSTPERRFLGFAYLPKDFVQYAAFVAQARDELSVLLRNEFTLEPQLGRYVLLLLSATGWLSRALGVDLVFLLPLLQLAGGTALLLVCWRLLSFYFTDERARLLTLALVAFSGGLEWVVWWTEPLHPPGVSLVEGIWPLFCWNTFEGLFHPFQVWCQAAAAQGSVLLLRYAREGGRGRLALAALLVPLVYAAHGYSAIAWGASLAATAALLVGPALRGRGAARGSLAAVCTVGACFVVPFALSQWQSQDEVFRATAQAMSLSGQGYSIAWWPLGFGLLLPLAAAGLWSSRQREGLAWALLRGSLLAGLVLTHLPVLSPYKFIQMLHLPVCIAAGVALSELPALAHRLAARRVWAALAAAALLATNLTVLMRSLREVPDCEELYLTRGELDALEALRRLEPGPVLSDATTGGYVPWLARKPVYVGHWFLTLRGEEKWREVQRFFSPRVPTARKRALLEGAGIRYVFYGPRERRLGVLDPDLPLAPVVDAEGVRVYRVVGPRERGSAPAPAS